MKLIVMCGLPNSGKSTKAKALAAQTGATVIALDGDGYWKKHRGCRNPQIVVDDALSDVKAALLRGEDVIFDSVNATKAGRKHVLDFCRMDGVDIICAFIDTPAEVCIERDKAFWSKVFARAFEPPTDDEGFIEIVVYHNEDE